MINVSCVYVVNMLRILHVCGWRLHVDIAEASMQAFHSLRFCSECMMNNIAIKAVGLGLNCVPSIAVSLSSWELS